MVSSSSWANEMRSLVKTSLLTSHVLHIIELADFRPRSKKLFAHREWTMRALSSCSSSRIDLGGNKSRYPSFASSPECWVRECWPPKNRYDHACVSSVFLFRIFLSFSLCSMQDWILNFFVFVLPWNSCCDTYSLSRHQQIETKLWSYVRKSNFVLEFNFFLMGSIRVRLRIKNLIRVQNLCDYFCRDTKTKLRSFTVWTHVRKSE